MITRFFKTVILKNFYSIELNSTEKNVVDDSVKDKYVPAAKIALIYTLISIPALIVYDPVLIATVLVPVTMVAGTAWFSISLSSVKKKFENFGIELTTDVFKAFAASLLLLSLLVLTTFLKGILVPISEIILSVPFGSEFSGLLGFIVIFKLCYFIFIGSMKYDINDAMLAGQNESAEIYFKRSLSLLRNSIYSLKAGRGLAVANYNLSLAFYEVFSFLIEVKGLNKNLREQLDKTFVLRKNANMGQNEADKISLSLVSTFLSYVSPNNKPTIQNIENIKTELAALIRTQPEPQELVDVRFSTILNEMAAVLEREGEGAFKRRIEIELKYIVPTLESLDLSQYPHNIHLTKSYKDTYIQMTPRN